MMTAACGREEAPPAESGDEAESAAAAPEASSMPYPEARRDDVVDDYFGTEVADPYRWMEDLDDAELKAWIEAEIMSNPSCPPPAPA